MCRDGPPSVLFPEPARKTGMCAPHPGRRKRCDRVHNPHARHSITWATGCSAKSARVRLGRSPALHRSLDRLNEQTDALLPPRADFEKGDAQAARESDEACLAEVGFAARRGLCTFSGHLDYLRSCWNDQLGELSQVLSGGCRREVILSIAQVRLGGSHRFFRNSAQPVG